MIPNSRTKTRFLASASGFGLIMLATVAAQGPVQIHPAPPPVDRPINMVVLADGFTSAQEDDFNEAAANLFTYGLLADPYFNARKDLFSVKTIFKPVLTPSASQFGFALGTGVTNCSIRWNDPQGQNTADLIEAAAAPGNPGPGHVIVIGNYSYNFGCSNDTWTYVTVGAVGEQVLQHELGHLLGGLKDEYAIEEFRTTAYPGVFDTLNCSNTSPPQWTGSGLPPTITNAAECALYGKDIVHAYNDCIMGIHGGAFCPLCMRELQLTWDYYSNPANWNPPLQALAGSPGLKILTAGFAMQQPAPTAPRQLRVLASLNRTSKAIQILRATDVTGRVSPRQRRVGAYVYEIWESNKVLDLGVVAGDPFETHGYRGGSSQHTRVPGEAPKPAETANIVVPIPGVWREDVLRPERSIEVRFYRLSPQVKDSVINVGLWEKLKAANQVESLGQIDAGQLKSFLLPPGKVVAPPRQEPVPPAKKPAGAPPVKKQ